MSYDPEKMINWKRVSESSGDDKFEAAQAEVDKLDYVYLTDVFLNRDRGASAVLHCMDTKFRCGNGVKQPSPDGTYRLRPLRQFAVEGRESDTVMDAFAYLPGEVVTWKQQIYNRLPRGSAKGESKKKLTKEDIEHIRKRGELDKIMDTGSAVVDEHGLITVSYQDAAQLLSNNGFVVRDGHAIGICDGEQFSNRQIRHKTEDGKWLRRTRCNWRYQEIPPWEDPANKPKRGRTAKDDSNNV